MPAEIVLDYSNLAPARYGIRQLVRYTVGILLLQCAMIAFCEYEVQNFGRSAHGSWYRNAWHTSLRLEFACGRVAMAVCVLALINLFFVTVRLSIDRRSPGLAKRIGIALPIAVIPLAVQLAIIFMYAGFCYE
jgi:hypothetical protein